MQAFAVAQNPPAVLSGVYAFSGVCKNAFGFTTFGTYDGTVTFSQNAGGSPSFVAQNPAAASVGTSTLLASTPASPVNTGVPVTFTAHVTPASGTATAVGTVQLLDGTTAIGSPTAVDASGNAAITTSFVTAGSHSVTAAFTGGTGFGNSVSAATPYTVNLAPNDQTATSLVVSPATATSADTVTLTAHVADSTTPASVPSGSVQFVDGTTNLGAPVALNGSGNAVLSQTFAEGAHSFSATYLPGTAPFNTSVATSQAYTVAHFAGAQASETIETTINPGTLAISVADTSTVVLPSPQLNADATYLVTTGALHQVTVADTRSGNPGWVVSGQVTDFHNTTGPNTTPINGYNLGWAPAVNDHNPGQTIVPGAVVLPAAPATVVDLAAGDVHGLKVSRTLASAAAGAGTGTAHLGAALTLNVPTTVIAGTYDATLTLTAI